MKEQENFARVLFPAKSENEGFARIVTAGFLLPLGVTATELADLKTVVSEAVTNAIVHGYRDRSEGKVLLELKWSRKGILTIVVKDWGVGIPDVDRAMEPFYTTDREGERSGMGLPIIAAFCDRVQIRSTPKGTRIAMKKKLK